MPSNELYMVVLPLMHINTGQTEQTLTLFPDRNLATEFSPMIGSVKLVRPPGANGAKREDPLPRTKYAFLRPSNREKLSASAAITPRTLPNSETRSPRIHSSS